MSGRPMTVGELKAALAEHPDHWLTPIVEVEPRTTAAGVVVDLIVRGAPGRD